MKIYRMIFCVFLFFSCNQEREIENPNEIWTKIELSELNSIVSQFDEILKKEYQVASAEEAYLKYSDYFIKNINSVPIFNDFGKLSDQIYKMSVFDKIWVQNKDSEYINLAMNSDYFIYLKYLGKKNKFINEYVERIEEANDIPPSLVAGFAKNINTIDLTDKNNRLVFAIHYLTLMNR